MSLIPGARLGPYEIQAPLGAGGMGAVYRARDSRLGRDVAVKVLPAGSLADAEAVQRLEQEARAAGGLSHPNILVVLDTGVHDGVTYVVSELLEGDTIRKRLETGPLPVRRALDYAVQIARGLAAAHDKGIVHRDLKPDNLFVTKDGLVKILDFGLAKRAWGPLAGYAATGSVSVTGPKTEPGMVMGSLGYMSPEQARGLPADTRSDVFSFGLVLYEMLSGRRAFRGETPADTIAAIINNDPPELGRLRPEVFPALERIVARCLEKRPEERFQSARDVAFAIEALSGAPPSGASAPTVVSLAPRPWGRRLAASAALLTTLGVVFVAGRYTAPSRVPEMRRLTQGRGLIHSARFAPDGRTVLYSAAAEAGPPVIYSTTSEATEPTPLGLPPAVVLGASSTGEMAVLLSRDAHPSVGTLARVPLAGGVPHELIDQVQDATWARDGQTLCVLRVDRDGHQQLEYPMGEVLYRPAWRIESPRVSPQGDRIAFSDGDAVQIIDTAGKNLTTLTDQTSHVRGLAWSPRGDEVWFTAGDDSGRALHAVSLSGKQRVLYRFPGAATLEDISGTGQILLTHGFGQAGIVVRAPGETRERELTGFGRARVAGLSPDGKTLLVEDGGDGGPGRSAHIARTEGSSLVRLGEGRPFDLSPDGRWVLAVVSASSSRLSLLPTQPGETRTVPLGDIDPEWGAWFPDGQRLLVLGKDTSGGRRLFVKDLEGGDAFPLTSEGSYPADLVPDLVPPAAVSPDGKLVAALGPDFRISLVPVDGGQPRETPGLGRVAPIRWGTDGRILYVRSWEDGPGRVYRVDPTTGEKEIWKDLPPEGPSGVGLVDAIQITPDGRSYAYSYSRRLLDLYLIEGLK
jgi:eukaryotic-like serine/threonine-protein kinase